MTFAQTRKKVLKILGSWSSREVNTITEIIAEAANNNPTVQMILDAVQRQGVWVGNLPVLTPQEQVALSPEFVRRFAQTAINPDYYGTVTASNGSPGRAVIFHLPTPE